MSGEAVKVVANNEGGSNFLFFAVIAALLIATYFFITREEYDENNVVDAWGQYNCLNSRGLNKLSGDEFEAHCEGKSFVATVYEKGCFVSSSCELSLYDPDGRGFDSDTLFEADLVEKIGISDEKLFVKGVISGRGFLGQVDVNIYHQEVVPLNEAELAVREEALKPKVDPALEAERLLLAERQAENARMMKYAEENDKKLAAQSKEVKVNPDSVNGMAEYRYYLKNGNIQSCLRGFSADVFVYECKEHKFN